MRLILASLLTAFGIAATAEVGLPPGAPPLRLSRPVGLKPAESRFPARGILHQHFKGGVPATLGGKRRLASLQLNRTGEWHLVLIEEGGNVHEGQAVPMRLFWTGKSAAIGGVEYALSFGHGNLGPQMTLAAADGSAPVVLSVKELKEAVYAAAAPVDALGPEWRFVYQHDVWEAADLPTFVFIEKNMYGLYFYAVRAEGVSWDREVERQAGNRRMNLSFDEENRIVVRSVPQAP